MVALLPRRRDVAARGQLTLLAAVALAFAGCAGLTPPLTANSSTPVPTAVRATTPAPLTDFSMAGRFSAKNEREQVSGQFRYTEVPGRRTLSLFSPLGTALAEIVAEGGTVTATDASGRQQIASSVAELLRPMLELPLSDAALSAWLQGLPAAGDAVTVSERDGNGLPARFRQGGWDIEVSARQATDSTAPRRMRWSLPAQPDIEVRWVIDEWTTP